MQSSWGPRIFWLVVFLLVVAGVFAWFYEPSSNSEFDRVHENFFRDSPVTISPQLFGCDLQFGVGDQEPTHWKGEISLAKGKLLHAIALQSGKSSSVQGGQFELSSVREEQAVLPALLRCAFLPDVSDSLVIVLGDTRKVIAISEVQNEKPLELFDGKVKLSRAPPVQVLHQSEDDVLSPYLARDQKGDEHLVYLNWERGKAIDATAVLSGNFDSLQHASDRASVRLSRFHQGVWSGAENVTGTLDTAVDPVVALDLSGRIYVAWAQSGLDGWDIYFRVKDPSVAGNPDNSWSESRKITDHPGSVQHLTATTDTKGKIWLAWQAWHYDHYDIFASVINDESHAWHTAGPVADHARDSEGRWYPSLASDSLGNVFVAWSVFRQGGFDVELVKLAANAPKAEPLSVATSLSRSPRPALACDGQNQLWIAYEEFEKTESKEISPLAAANEVKIRVRLLDAQGILSGLPALPLPKVHLVGEQSVSQPTLTMVNGNVPLLAYRYGQKLYFTVLDEQGWTEPKELAPLDSNSPARFVVRHQADCVVAYTSGQDAPGRSRLYVSAENLVPIKSIASSKQPPPVPPAHTADTADWQRFWENVRLFRTRPQDPELANQHLLRGLVFLPKGVTTGKGLISADCQAIEKLMCDWALVPESSDEPVSWRWSNQLHRLAFSQKSERILLSGYYRPPPQRGDAALIIQKRLDFAPLPTQQRLYSLLPVQGASLTTPVAREADVRLLERYLAETQELGFALTSDWRALTTYNPPSSSRGAETADGALLPFWYQPDLATMRVVAYCNGKSTESLLEALRDRHFYFATDDIYLLARCDKRIPGEVFQTARAPVITVQAQGTGKLAKVEIWRDNKIIMSEEPPGNAAVVECPNPDIDGGWHHYTVRVLQQNGAMAITQPFWIRYQP
jgi:hypothetical protein